HRDPPCFFFHPRLADVSYIPGGSLVLVITPVATSPSTNPSPEVVATSVTVVPDVRGIVARSTSRSSAGGGAMCVRVRRGSRSGSRTQAPAAATASSLKEVTFTVH